MSQQHNKELQQIQAVAVSVTHPTLPRCNGRMNGARWLAALWLVAGLGNPLLPSATAAQAPPPPVPTVVGTPPISTDGPRIQFATPTHDFGRIRGGEVVKHTFLFTNIGNQVLEITGVHASCGCTTSGEFTRKVEPGKTGEIPIQFSSGNFSGNIGKTITVNCNDATQPSVMLQINANIWKPVEVLPQFATLNVTSESPSNATIVRIINHEEAPLTLSAPTSSNPAFVAELTTNQPGKEFQLLVRSAPPLPAGNVQGQITMKTSSTNMPVINVTAWANVRQAVMVMPAQVTLPAGALPSARPYAIAIRNNGTNSLVLSEPTVNATGVEVQTKEVQPGRYFTVTLKFPAGFEIPRGEKVELSVKSNHPQHPVITVPILQSPRPLPTATPVKVPPPKLPQAAAQ